MASRYNTSNLHQRDPRSALFEGYDNHSTMDRNRNTSSPAGGSGYGYNSAHSSRGVSGGYGMGSANGASAGGYRAATPNSRGQYSDATLNELESQNDGEVEGIMGKVRLLKSMTIAIGDEIRDSSALAEKMNDQFDNSRLKLKGTMNRMLVMAQKTGVPWKWWLVFFAIVGILFWYVWLF